MLIRKAEKAGSWYSDVPTELEDEIARYSNHHVEGLAPVKAAIVPHAGLFFSGNTAGRSFSAIKQTRAQIKTIIILGAVHTTSLYSPAVWAEGEWQCPLGAACVNSELAQKIINKTSAEDNPRPHYGDNAIELQIPFIKHLFPEAQIIPIAMPPSELSVQFGRELWRVCEDECEDIAVVGSTDLTHYGMAYGFCPAGNGEEGHQWSKENDLKLIELALELHPEPIITRAREDHSACGCGALAGTTAYAKAAGCDKGVLLEHITSQEILPEDRSDMHVGYASIVFTGEDE